jgi:hypothetical protein
MHALARVVFVFALAGALASLACAAPVEDETVVVASLLVVGSVDENTCGALAVMLPDPWSRRTELRRGEGDLYYWREITTGVNVLGTRTSDGEYRFRGSSQAEIFAADPTIDYPGCRVRLDDELRFTLDGSAMDAGAAAGGDAGVEHALEGRQRTVVSIVAGSNCAPALNANGGNFLALPCEFAYDLAGEAEAGAD